MKRVLLILMSLALTCIGLKLMHIPVDASDIDVCFGFGIICAGMAVLVGGLDEI